MAVARKGALEYQFVFSEIAFHQLGARTNVCSELCFVVGVDLLLLRTVQSEQKHTRKEGYENFLFDVLFYFNIQ
jgi:hypothetical protein